MNDFAGSLDATAIELVASRVEALGVAQLLDRLDDRFALRRVLRSVYSAARRLPALARHISGANQRSRQSLE
jgi:predicted ATPase